MKLASEWDRLPKYLMADDGDMRDFVIHLHYPRFIIEFVGDSGTPLFIDDESEFIKAELAEGREPAATLARLMRESGDFFVECLNKDCEG